MAFEEYVIWDADIMTSELFTVDELIEDKLSGANLSDDEEEYQEVIPPLFKGTIYSIEKFRAYLTCLNTSEKHIQ